MEVLSWFWQRKGAFNVLQGQQPQTLAHALADSPAGLLGWNAQLFDEALDDEFVLANVTLYWLTGTAGTSIRHYYENNHAAAQAASGPTTVPIGLAAAADGDFRSIRRFAARDHTRITSWNALPGVTGHYSADTNPDQLAADIRRFFRPLRPAAATKRNRATDRHDQGDMTMQNWTVITESLDLLEAVAAAVTDATRLAPTPCAEWTVAQVLQHAAGDQLAWAAAIGVGTGPAENPFAPSGHLDGSVDDLIKPALAAARAAWETVQADDDAVPTPLPQGPLPARDRGRGLRPRRGRARLGHRRRPRPPRVPARRAGRAAAPGRPGGGRAAARVRCLRRRARAPARRRRRGRAAALPRPRPAVEQRRPASEPPSA